MRRPGRSRRRPFVELAEVGRHRGDRLVGRGIDDLEPDRGGAQQSVGRRERRGELVALAIGERIDQSSGEVVRSPVEVDPGTAAVVGERGDPTPAVRGIGDDLDESVALELA